MKELILKIKNFLLDIQPVLEAAKNQIPVPMSTEEKIVEVGTIEMVESLMEEVTAISEVSDVLSEEYLTPAAIGLSVVEETIEEETIEESNEVKLQKQLDTVMVELEATKLELSSFKVIAETTKLELSKTEQEYKNQFSLSAIGKAEEVNPKEYLRQLLKNNKK